MRLLFLIFLIAFSFSPEEPELPYPCFFNDHDRWLLHSYRNNDNGEANTKPAAYQKFFEVIIQFDYDEHLEAGSFEGQSLSNLIYGKYNLLKDSGIKVTQFGHSKMSEPSWGVDNLEVAMNNLNSFSCEGDSLFLNYNNGAHSLIFLKSDIQFYDWDEYFNGQEVAKELIRN